MENLHIPNHESVQLRKLAGDFSRHPQQLNAILEADAEILSPLSGSNEYLVVKTDGIYEEIRQKLYEDPWLIGWMVITAPLSDLAAVGTEPDGVLLSLVLSNEQDDEWMRNFQKGISDALAYYGTFLLGGDTNHDHHFSATATAIARTSRKPMMRKGIEPGQHIYCTNKMGDGNAFAYSKYFDAGKHHSFKPVARFSETKIIREFATACIDSSDGFFPALAVLSEINNVGFDISIPLFNILHQAAAEIVLTHDLPSWMLLAGPHGEYELVFSIPAKDVHVFESEAKKINWHPLYIGRSKKEISIHFLSDSLGVHCSPSKIPNLYFESGNDVNTYMNLLLDCHKNWSSTQTSVYENR